MKSLGITVVKKIGTYKAVKNKNKRVNILVGVGRTWYSYSITTQSLNVRNHSDKKTEYTTFLIFSDRLSGMIHHYVSLTYVPYDTLRLLQPLFRCHLYNRVI